MSIENLQENNEIITDHSVHTHRVIEHMRENHPDLLELKISRGYLGRTTREADGELVEVIDTTPAGKGLYGCWHAIMQVRENRKARLEATAINERPCNLIDEEHHVVEDVANDDVRPAVSLDIVSDTGE